MKEATVSHQAALGGRVEKRMSHLDLAAGARPDIPPEGIELWAPIPKTVLDRSLHNHHLEFEP